MLTMLSKFLPLKPAMIMALVGAGGKTTTMFRLAAELAARGERVITTTTTHIYPPAPEETGALVLTAERLPLLEQAAAALAIHQHITAAAGPAPEGKLRGLPREWIAELRNLAGETTVLVEADGARGRMLKAPAEHEPVIPIGADLVLLLASAEALGQPLSDAIAHRTERVAAVSGLHPGEPITPQALARLATHEQGLLKGAPGGAPAILVLTHVAQQHPGAAEEAAQLALASGRLAGVLLCSLEWAKYLAR
jgi:probable selenium-dependent hydroxylase accessory protein YqeC